MWVRTKVCDSWNALLLFRAGTPPTSTVGPWHVFTCPDYQAYGQYWVQYLDTGIDCWQLFNYCQEISIYFTSARVAKLALGQYMASRTLWNLGGKWKLKRFSLHNKLSKAYNLIQKLKIFGWKFGSLTQAFGGSHAEQGLTTTTYLNMSGGGGVEAEALFIP